MVLFDIQNCLGSSAALNQLAIIIVERNQKSPKHKIIFNCVYAPMGSQYSTQAFKI